MKQVSLFGNGIKSISPSITAQRRVNVYYDVRSDSDKNNVVMIGTPGLTLQVSLPTSPIRGMWQDGEYAVVAAGNALYLLAPPYATYALLGSFGASTATIPVSFSTNETQLCFVDGDTGYVVELAGLSALINSQDLIILQQLALLAEIATAAS